MTPQEQQLISDLFDRLAGLSGSRDPQAERFIAERMAATPGASYAMAQTIVVQDHALKAASDRIAGLERDLAAARAAADAPAAESAAGSFAPWTNAPRPAGSLPQARDAMPAGRPAAGAPVGAPMGAPAGFGTPAVPAAVPPAQSAAWDARPAAATSVPSFGRSSFGGGSAMGGFLASAGQIALGVAGGALLADAARSMFSGGSGERPAEVVNNETVNETVVEEPAAASPWGSAAGGDAQGDAGQEGDAGQDATPADWGGNAGPDDSQQDSGYQDAGFDPGQDTGSDFDGGDDSGWA